MVVVGGFFGLLGFLVVFFSPPSPPPKIPKCLSPGSKRASHNSVLDLNWQGGFLKSVAVVLCRLRWIVALYFQVPG